MQREEARRDTQRKNEAARLEETELQAALEAVAEVERKEQERHLLQEKEMIEKLEALRLAGITEFYESARQSLLALHELQLEKIVCRHKAAISKTQRALDNIIFRKNNHLRDTSRLRSEQEARLREARLTHTRELSATLIRHCQDQDMLIANLGQHGRVLDESLRALQLQPLLNEQDLERQTLTKQHRRLLEKLEARFTTNGSVATYIQRTAEFEEEEAEVKTHAEHLEKQILADRRWVALARVERLSMLNEDEQILANSGADAPALAKPAKTRARSGKVNVMAANSTMGPNRGETSSAKKSVL